MNKQHLINLIKKYNRLAIYGNADEKVSSYEMAFEDIISYIEEKYEKYEK